jgi:hypothetical protein
MQFCNKMSKNEENKEKLFKILFFMGEKILNRQEEDNAEGAE